MRKTVSPSPHAHAHTCTCMRMHEGECVYEDAAPGRYTEQQFEIHQGAQMSVAEREF